MLNLKTMLSSAAVGALSLVAFSSVAMAGANSAGPVSEAGETIGLALGAALPQGVYFVDTASIVHNESSTKGAFKASGSTLDVLVNIPVVAWSTPWDLLGGHVEAYAAFPEASVETSGKSVGSSSSNGFYNPALLVGEAWNLGHDLHFSNFIGGYAPVNQPGFSSANGTNNVWTFNERAALSYLGNGYNITAHAIYGHSTKDTEVADGCGTVSCQRADYLNVDFAALKTFGKWELGPVAYYSGDVARTANSTQGNRELALGAFAGYALGGVTVQTYVTHDVAASDQGHLFGSDDTRFFLRFIVPLWNPAK